MTTVGERLKHEREKLKLTQAQLGEIGGVRKLTQFKYESGASCPDADYLSKVANVGVDILYVILGTRADIAINDEERLLLHTFRHADPAVRRFMLYGGAVL